MYSINFKGVPNPKDKKLVKLTAVFFQTGYSRVKRIIDVTGAYKDWDLDKQSFKTKKSENQVKNILLSDLKLKYLTVADKWELDGKNWCPTEWADYFEEKVHTPEKVKIMTVSQVIDYQIDFFEKKERFKNGNVVSSFSNIREYGFLKSSLNAFTKRKYHKAFSGFYFKDINEQFLNDYALFLQLRGAENGNKGAVVARLKKLRAVCNPAFKLNIPEVNISAFRCVELKMKQNKFVPKTIPHETIKKIESMDRSGFTKTEQFHIDMFLFCFYAGGMANIDAIYLRKESIKKKMIVYERMKVCKEAKVPLINKAEEIINKYKDKSYGDFVFPVFTHKHTTEEKRRIRLERFNWKVNKTLEKVRTKIRYKEKITWYSARGSFITKMINDGYNPALVVEQAGNSPNIIFKHYYKTVNSEELRKNMNKAF
ncbi:hypothetical protein D0T49_04680 [Paludibacter sp. 221]|uniref:phage integrase SAM-like domain-containing protein n=1 Tax=Paludibacter sp. 221 TaxID=2302939 RepID=UPI0013D0A0A8|nr:phage integrase SAM-like domain-containing protein [Paludibacter sp. 221]NDV46333.1 hypothetical protein [Paludibacter sp. 221]